MNSAINRLASRLRILFLRRVYRRAEFWTSFALLACIPLVTIATVLAIVDFVKGEFSDRLIAFMLFDFVFFTIIAARLVFALAGKGRDRDSGIQNPLRVTLTRLFALLAFIPTLVIAVVASLVLNVGIGDSLAVEVREELDRASTASESYASGKVQEIQAYATGLASRLNQEILRYPNIDLAQYRQPLHMLQSDMPGAIRHVFIIDGNCNLIVRGVASYLFDYRPPPGNVMQMLAADLASPGNAEACGEDLDLNVQASGEPAPVIPVNAGSGRVGSVFESGGGNQLTAVVRLESTVDYFLVATVDVNSSIMALRKSLARKTETSRDLVQKITYRVFQYSILYMSLALVLVLIMTQLGTMYAKRLSKPVQELARAAKEVGEGNRNVNFSTRGANEIGRLGRAFKLMIDQLDASIRDLERTRNAAERRERQFRGVLANVTAGVIGLESDETIRFMNRSAGRLLRTDHVQFNREAGDETADTGIRELFPEIAAVIDQHVESGSSSSQHQLRVSAEDGVRELLVRMATRRNDAGRIEGYVIAIDDVTQLVRAESKAAWTNVAQQIAHEIKNAMTPIRLAVGQLHNMVQSRFDPQSKAIANRYTGRVDASVSGLIRISDEFSRFARLPDPVPVRRDLVPLVREAMAAESARASYVAMELEGGDLSLDAKIDKDLFHQALTNLLKNSKEAIDARLERQSDKQQISPRIRVSVESLENWLQIRIMDNGIGFPANRNRSHMIKPFVTFRAGGTGLGLAYAERIIESHNGELSLHDAPIFEGDHHHGAMVQIRLAKAQHRAAPKSLGSSIEEGQ